MKIIAHRGDNQNYPENTLVAFKEAAKVGADGVELDVHLSLDKQLVVHHDYNLQYPSGGKGLIPEVMSEYIKTLDAGSWFSPKFSNEKIPFLSEVFKDLGKDIHYEIELKGYTKDFIDVILSTVKKYDVIENIEFTSPHVYILTYIKHHNPKCKTGMFVSSIPDWMDKNLGREIIRNNALLGDVDVIHIPLSILTKNYVDNLHASNLKIHGANCDTEIDIKQAYKLGLDQYSTNMLSLALSIKAKYDK